jgi:hypothetical protein
MKAMRIVPRVLAAAAIIAATTSCGSVVRSSRSPVLLVVDQLLAIRGSATTSTASATLASDVFTLVTTGGTCTTTNNEVTITRVRVSYRRTDGRNQEGVDVPYGFDTATTATVTAGGNLTFGFPLVRIQAKQESPLVELRTNGQILSMIGDVTFYGQDTVGNTVTATGSINIDFGNFGDQ